MDSQLTPSSPSHSQEVEKERGGQKEETHASTSTVVVVAHMLNGDEITLDDVDEWSTEIGHIKDKIQATNPKDLPRRRQKLFWGTVELEHDESCLYSYNRWRPEGEDKERIVLNLIVSAAEDFDFDLEIDFEHARTGQYGSQRGKEEFDELARFGNWPHVYNINLREIRASGNDTLADFQTKVNEELGNQYKYKKAFISWDDKILFVGESSDQLQLVQVELHDSDSASDWSLGEIWREFCWKPRQRERRSRSRWPHEVEDDSTSASSSATSSSSKPVKRLLVFVAPRTCSAEDHSTEDHIFVRFDGVYLFVVVADVQRHPIKYLFEIVGGAFGRSAESFDYIKFKSNIGQGETEICCYQDACGRPARDRRKFDQRLCDIGIKNGSIVEVGDDGPQRSTIGDD